MYYAVKVKEKTRDTYAVIFDSKHEANRCLNRLLKIEDDWENMTEEQRMEYFQFATSKSMSNCCMMPAHIAENVLFHDFGFMCKDGEYLTGNMRFIGHGRYVILDFISSIAKKTNSLWAKTDDNQWQKKLSESEYVMAEVREIGNDMYVMCRGIVNMDDYTEKDAIKGYYSSVEDFRESYAEKYRKGILAECVFESTPYNELMYEGPFKTFEEAKNALKKYIGK